MDTKGGKNFNRKTSSEGENGCYSGSGHEEKVPVSTASKEININVKGNSPKSKRKRRRKEKIIESRQEELPWPQPCDAQPDVYAALKVEFSPIRFMVGSGLTNHSRRRRIPSNSLPENNHTQEHVHNEVTNLDIAQKMRSLRVNGTEVSQSQLNGRVEERFRASNPLKTFPPTSTTKTIGASNDGLNGDSARFRRGMNDLSSVPAPQSVLNTSSDEVCTLYANQAVNPSLPAFPMAVGGRTMTRPPIGVFWDIENCSVPRYKSALVTLQRIRECFFHGHFEAEFVVVCDIRKESAPVIQELNDGHATVIHVSGNSKNAADDKLRQCMRRFADIYQHPVCPTSAYPATIILISGDINFSSDLSDLKHRKRLYVILLHNKHAPEALLMCSHEHYDFHSILADLPTRTPHREYDKNQQIPLKGGLNAMDLVVIDLPHVTSRNIIAIKKRLNKLSENCGGKVVNVHDELALVRFPNKEAALRASKRMQGEDVLGSRIRVLYSSEMEFPSANGNARSGSSGQGLWSHNQVRNKDVIGSQLPSWKPSWKSRTTLFGSADGFMSSHRPFVGSSRSCMSMPQAQLNNNKKEMNIQNTSHNTSGSSHSSASPGESSREASPHDNNAKISEDNQALPANNVTFAPHSSADVLNNSNLSTAFAFRQNLFPLPYQSNNPIPGSPSNILSDNSAVQSQQNGTPGLHHPKLYSVPFSPILSAAPENTTNIPSSNSDLNGLERMAGMANQEFAAGSSASAVMNSGLLNYCNALNSAAQASSHPRLDSTSTFSSPSNKFPRNMKQSDAGEFLDVHVSNIDPTLGDWKGIRSTLVSAFGEHVGVKAAWVYVNPVDNTVSAVVRVGGKDEAQVAVSQLHRKKLGNKRIFISFDQGGNVDPQTLKTEVASLLQDVPGSVLPLFKFREMFEKRYRRSVSSADLYRLRDVVTISENSMSSTSLPSAVSAGINVGRTISLSSEWKGQDDKNLSLYCVMHPPKKSAACDRVKLGWAEKEADIALPNVVISLQVLSENTHSLLNSHEGSLPLISFVDCYESYFEALERVGEGSGVPLEHLISCVSGVEIIMGENGMKRVKWNEKKDFEAGLSLNQPLAVQLAQFGREMVDLLKTFPRCSLPFSKLIPAYHHHFGRQCRVADYGHFNLQSLLQTLPHVVQIMGASQNRILTLSHRAQMKRFATDLLRVLKAHGGAKKQVKVDDFPQVFSQVFTNRVFQPEDYGLCFFADLISALLENSTLVALVKDEDGNQMLAVPKREQTPQELHKTRIFASEVIELLRHSIRYEMPFAKFIPSYHHHFGRQCRVSDYGFSKLAELFEAISDTVVCVSPNGLSPLLDCGTEDKIIRLVPKEQIKVIGEQLSKLLQKKADVGEMVLLSDLDELFIEEHGFQLRPDACDSETIEDLAVSKLGRYLKVENGIVTLVDRQEMEQICQEIAGILAKYPDYKMDLEDFLKAYCSEYGTELDPTTLERNLSESILLSQDDETGSRTIQLTPMRIFSREIVALLEETGSGSLMLSNIEPMYLQRYGQPIRPAQMGYPSILALLEAIPEVVQVRGKHRAKRVILAGQAVSDTSSLDESFRSQNQKSRHNDSYQSYNGRHFTPTRSFHSADRPPRYTSTAIKHETRRWSDSPIRSGRNFNNKPVAPPLFSPVAVTSPMGQFPGRQMGPQDSNVFTFDRVAAPLSPPVYDLWMRGDSMASGTPPVSPPVVWTYHPIVYPSSTPPANSGNILMPTHISYAAGPWSPPAMTSTCYERMPPHNGNVMGTEFLFTEQQNRISSGMEHGRNEA